MRHLYTHTLALFALLIMAGCTESKNLSEELFPEKQPIVASPKITLEQAMNIQKWVTGGRAAIQQPLQVSVPYRQAGIFEPGSPEAIALKFKALRGQNIHIYVKSNTDNFELFADLVDLSQKKFINKQQVILPSNAHSFSFHAEETKTYLLSFQPELLKGGKYEVEIHTSPSLIFPVLGKNSNNIGSYWGAPRDKGERWHKGVDIFAAKGTPVVAVTDGVIYSAGSNLLGGNFVRLYDSVYNRTYYYAHLDTNMVKESTYVKAGDIIGTIGNTGNAENTLPHLHFSVYCGSEGVVDPLHFIQNPQNAPPTIADAALIGKFVKIAAPRLNVRKTPGEAQNYLTTLQEDHVCRVEAVTDNWLMVKLPDNKKGFISADYVMPVAEPVEQMAGTVIYPRPQQDTLQPEISLINTSSIFHMVKR